MTPVIPRILVMDDEPHVRRFLEEALRDVCRHLCLASSLQEALVCAYATPPDIVLADICMPGCGGTELLRIMHDLKCDCAVVLMSGQATLAEVASGIRYQPADFLVKPFSLEALVGAVQNTYKELLRDRQRRSEKELLSDHLVKRTEQLEIAQSDLRESYRSALECLVATLEAREPQTYAHSFRVRAYSVHLAKLMNIPAASLPSMAYAALLHDIGKIAVPDSILLKPGKLKAEEFESMKHHSEVGERIVRRMRFLDGAARVIRHHHESWDGHGYPDGLRGRAIPFESRLFAVADTLDAMTSDRCYRSALRLADARAEIARCAGLQFDPEIAVVANDISNVTWSELRERADADARAALVPDFSGVPVSYVQGLDQQPPTIV